MKERILNLLLIITSLFGYLEWGGNKHSFLFQAEAEIISKLLSGPTSVVHPFTVAPLAGQILLIVTLFQKKPWKVLTYTGIGSMAMLIVFMFVIGILSFNYKIVISTIPFIVVSIVIIKEYRRTDNNRSYNQQLN